jgi:hypothetical protein
MDNGEWRTENRKKCFAPDDDKRYPKRRGKSTRY